MKNQFKRTTLVLCTAFVSCTSFAQSWVNVGDSCYSLGPAPLLSIAIHPSGNPYVLYRDDWGSQTANVIKYDGSSWDFVGNQGFSNSPILSPSIAITSSGNIFSAFISSAHRASVNVMKFNGIIWDSVGNTGFTRRVANYVSLALGMHDTLYVGYMDDSLTHFSPASVSKFDGTNWVFVGTRRFTPGGASWTSLATNAAGTPYLAYVDHANGRKASVMKFDGSNWVNVGIPGFSDGAVENTALAIDAAGTPYVAYQDSANAAKLTVMKYNGAAWVPVGAVGLSAGVAYLSSKCLAIDASGTLYVVYGDASNGSKATVKKFDGSSWTTVGLAGFSSGIAGNPTLAIDASGTPFVAFSDTTEHKKARVMKYAVSSGLNDIKKYGSVCIYPNPAANRLVVAAKFEIKTMTITNVFGQQLFFRQYNSKQVVVDIDELPKGLYVVKVNNEVTEQFLKQ